MTESINLIEQPVGFSRLPHEAQELEPALSQDSNSAELSWIHDNLIKSLLSARLNNSAEPLDETLSLTREEWKSVRSGLYALLPFKQPSDSVQHNNGANWLTWVDRYYLRGSFLTVLFSFRIWDFIPELTLSSKA